MIPVYAYYSVNILCITFWVVQVFFPLFILQFQRHLYICLVDLYLFLFSEDHLPSHLIRKLLYNTFLDAILSFTVVVS